MQDSGRDSKPGCGPRNITPGQAGPAVNMATLPMSEYRAVMVDLFTTTYTSRDGFLCAVCPDGRPHRHAR